MCIPVDGNISVGIAVYSTAVRGFIVRHPASGQSELAFYKESAAFFASLVTVHADPLKDCLAALEHIDCTAAGSGITTHECSRAGAVDHTQLCTVLDCENTAIVIYRIEISVDTAAGQVDCDISAFVDGNGTVGIEVSLELVNAALDMILTVISEIAEESAVIRYTVLDHHDINGGILVVIVEI